jgi:Tol biopolymer transport system component
MAVLAGRSALALTLTLASAGVVVPVVHAAFPGANGKIVFTSTRDGDEEIYSMESDGSGQVALTNSAASDTEPACSPDGTKIALASYRDSAFLEIYVMGAGGASPTRLTNNSADDTSPAWSPDGSQLVFSSRRDGNFEIYVMDADGANQTRLTTDPGFDVNPAWSPDGTKIAFQTNRHGAYEIYLMDPDGTNQTRLTNNTVHDHNPSWSPDGTKIAFGSDRNGDTAIYIMDANGANETNLTNGVLDVFPAWSPDGTRIAFSRAGANGYEIYAVDADGTNQTMLTNATQDYHPDWCPDVPPTILGKLLRVTSALSGNETVIAYGRELASPNTVVGNPIASGATVRIIANGAADQDATFTLPAGLAPPGGAGWQAICSGCGYLYKDLQLANGPVKKCFIKKLPSGTFHLKCILKGTIPGLAPPGGGTDGGMIFTIPGGDEYCVNLGGAAGGTVTNTANGLTFKVANATAEAGCPMPPPLCCATQGVACADLPADTAAADCTALGSGTLGAPGQVCDPSSGSCQATAGATQACCDNAYGTGLCLEGPMLPFHCNVAGGTYHTDARCGLDGFCAYCGEFITKWGTHGSGTGQFDDPSGVAIDAAGNVYVADSNNNRIQKFSSSGAFLTQWGSTGSGDGQFNGPVDVAVDGSGNVYVADWGNARIQKFTSTGTFVTKWGSSGSAGGQFLLLTGVAASAGGDVYTTEAGALTPVHRVQHFDSTGAFLETWGEAGSGDGQFLIPTGIAVDGSGDVYVADAGNNRVQKFDGTGTFLTKWGTSGGGTGQFSNLSRIAVDATGNVYVTEAGNDRVQRFTSTGTFRTTWGSLGSGDGQFNDPSGIAIGPAGDVYVVEAGNDRVQKFECP